MSIEEGNKLIRLEVKEYQLTEEEQESIKDARDQSASLNRKMLGTSGTRIFATYFDEEYLTSLQETQRADKYDEMRRSDPQVQMLLSARKNPILSANWFVEAGSSDPEHAKHKEFIEYEFFHRKKAPDKPFTSLLEEIISFIVTTFEEQSGPDLDSLLGDLGISLN